MKSLSQYALMAWLSRCFTETQSLSTPPGQATVASVTSHSKEGNKHDQVCMGGGFIAG